MKKIIAGITISLASTLCAMQDIQKPVTLPPAEVLKKRFIDQKIPEKSVEKLNIHTEFGGKTVNPHQIGDTLDAIFGFYTQNIEDPKERDILYDHMQQHKPKAIVAILLDHPEIIVSLQENIK